MCIRQAFKVVALLSLFMTSCGKLGYLRFFAYDLETVKMPNPAGIINPEPCLAEYALDAFMVRDSVVVSYNIGKEQSILIQDLANGHVLSSLCQVGRGPGEVLMINPYYDIVDGHAYLVDIMKSRFHDLNLVASMAAAETIFDKTIDVGQCGDYEMYFNSVRYVGEDSLLCHNPNRNLEIGGLRATPAYYLYDLNSGEMIRPYKMFDNIPPLQTIDGNFPSDRLLASSDCTLPSSNTVAIAMHCLPVLSLLDCKSGIIRGIRFSGVPRFKKRSPGSYFGGITADGNRIYALYYGDKEPLVIDEAFLMNRRAQLVVMSYDAGVITRYDLGGPYSGTIDYSDGYLYLSRWDEPDRLYKIAVDIL